jgi:hypothetical protein
MEETDTISIGEYDNNGGGDVVVEKVNGEWGELESSVLTPKG